MLPFSVEGLSTSLPYGDGGEYDYDYSSYYEYYDDYPHPIFYNTTVKPVYHEVRSSGELSDSACSVEQWLEWR